VSKLASQASQPHFVLDQWLELVKYRRSTSSGAPILHHYTDAYGIEGILSSSTLWATATQFSNDLSEIEYAVSMAKQEVAKEIAKLRKMSPWREVLFGHLAHLLEIPLHTFGQPFIVCFCEDGDLLSQWRAYGKSSGFSIGLRLAEKRGELNLSCKHGFRTTLAKVIYEPSKQKARLRDTLSRFVALVDQFPFKPESSRGHDAHVELSLLLVLEITNWACIVKHSSFTEEREWRVITYPREATLTGTHPENFEGVSIRPTSTLLLPYMTLEPKPGARLPIVGIRCGPSRFQEQSARATRILLQKTGYKAIAIALSSAPLRI